MKKKILLVDDDQFFRDVFVDKLNHEKYMVFSAAGGAEAIEKIATNDFDVVITDIGMPKVNGIEVLKFTKKNKPKTKLIMMSSYVIHRVVNEVMKLGADEYIEKSSFLKDIFMILDKIT
jgi:DNA-binding NarL/FixJ family response regulator